MPWPVLRGRVYRAKHPDIDEPKVFLIVSNNRRNARLRDVLAVRLTTSPKPSIPSIVELEGGEVFTGRACCDDIVNLYEPEIQEDLGALSGRAMLRVENGLRAALDLDKG